MNRYVFSGMLIVGLIVFGIPGWSAETNPVELAFESYEAAYFPGKDVQWEARLEITDRQDRTRIRKLSILRKNTGEYEQKYYAYFHEPADIRRMVFMVWTHGAKNDDRWLYLPAVDMTQRITGQQKRNAFAGSNFTYEDMTGRYPGLDNLTFKGTDKVGDRKVWVLHAEPKNPDMVEFEHYTTYIDQETKLPLKGEFYTPDGDLHRTLTLEKWKQIDGFPTPIKQKAVNHQTGSTTVATMSNIQYNQDIPERVFQPRYLQRPPTPFIQP